MSQTTLHRFLIEKPNGHVITETSCVIETTEGGEDVSLPTDSHQIHPSTQSRTEVVEVDRDVYEPVHIRITVDVGPLADVHEYMCQLGGRVLTAEEFSSSGVRHFHVFLEAPLELVRSRQVKLREKLKSQWTMLHGNDTYMISVAKVVDKMASYVVKDGHFKSKGFKQSELKILVESSYKKFDPKEYARKVMDIRQDYFHDKISRYQAIQRLVDLRCDSGMTRCSDLNHVISKIKDWTLQKDHKIRHTFIVTIDKMVDYWEKTEFRSDSNF